MAKLGLLFFLLCCFLSSYKASAQNVSNEGTDFWAVFPSHDPSTSQSETFYANITIYITAKTASRVTATCNGWISTKDIQANSVDTFSIARIYAYTEAEESNRVLQKKGIHIKVADGMPKIAVYAHIYAGFRSAASLILPQESLGQEYYSMNYDQSVADGSTSRNFLTLVASEPNTDLIIHPKSRSPISVHLDNAGDVYQYMPDSPEDITGAYVQIDPASPDNCTKRFAAFSGSTSVTIGCPDSRDPLYQQLYPTSSWGKTYSIIPFLNRYYYYRILAEEDNTTIRVNNESHTLNKGQVYEGSPRELGTEPKYITADKKISVAQYALTQNCAGPVGGIYGDPEMVLLNPVEFNIKNITLFSSDAQLIREKYINICIKTAATSSFKINGQPLSSGTWKILPANPELSYAQVQVYGVSSTLTADEGFNAIAYGFGDHESYAYSAGTNLAANNYLLVSNSVTGHEAPNACIEQESDFKIILPFKAQNDLVSWQLDEGIIININDQPREVQSANGDILYEYTYDANKIFPAVGEHTMNVKVTIPNVGNCLGRPLEYAFTFSAYPIPKAKFETSAQACFGDEILFTDKSELNMPDKSVDKWLWDFGDGNTSASQNPVHGYQSSGIKTVTLSAGLENGCLSDPVSFELLVKPKITADFNVNPVECITTEIVTTNNSAVEGNGANLNSWQWDFGDGSPKITSRIARHKYLAPGTYQVTLVAGTDNGCFSTPVTKEIIIKGLPSADFSIPQVCTSDMAPFINLSTDADGQSTGLTYSWDFGDITSPLNHSSDKDGAHQYSEAGIYTIKLTVTTAEGCKSEVSKQLTVNGSEVTADFEVVNKDNLCSDNSVSVINKSVTNGGRIIKIMWVPDGTKPEEAIIDEDPQTGKEYAFTYPRSVSASPRNFTIIMYAYSGMDCVEETRQTITIYPSPELSFDAVPPLCLNSGITKMQAKEILGIPGEGTFSGPGINADGTFDAAIAGIGNHKVIYTFATDKGCVAIKEQIVTVLPIPVATYSKDIAVYTGGTTQIDLVVTGDGLTYQWHPADGLDRDNVANPVVTGDTERTYTVIITSPQGCSIQEKIFVHIIPDIEVSNAFSPNGDGKNDTWTIRNIEIYASATVQIFNRYGESVYFSKGFYTPFDGNYKNRPLPVGTYYYIINPNNGRKALTGPLTIIR